MKYDLKQLLVDANNRKYAIPAFNFSDCWELRAILEAAKEERAPVIVASATPVMKTFTPKYLGAICEVFDQRGRFASDFSFGSFDRSRVMFRGDR